MDAVHDLRRADEFASDSTSFASDLKTQAEAPSRQIVDATVVRHNVVRVPPPRVGSSQGQQLDFELELDIICYKTYGNIA